MDVATEKLASVHGGEAGVISFGMGTGGGGEKEGERNILWWCAGAWN